MKRIDIEGMMKEQGLKSIDLVYKETDPFGMLCELKNGTAFLSEYT